MKHALAILVAPLLAPLAAQSQDIAQTALNVRNNPPAAQEGGFQPVEPASLAWKAVGERKVEEEWKFDPVSGALAKREKEVAGLLRGSLERQAETVEFAVTCEAEHAGALSWEAELPVENRKPAAIVMIEVATECVLRTTPAHSVVTLHGHERDGKAIAFAACDSSHVMNSGAANRMMVHLPDGFVPERIEVLATPARHRAIVRLGRVSFGSLDTAVSSVLGAKQTGALERDMVCLPLRNLRTKDLAGILRTRLAKPGDAVLDGTGRFAAESISLDGLPFEIPSGAKNLIAPPASTKSPNDKIEAMGVTLPRSKFFPLSRDDAIEIEVGRAVSEVFLLLAADMQPAVNRYALPMVPMRLRDIESFAVELVYDDGSDEMAFPYSLADGGYEISRLAGAYAVPADHGRKLAKVRLLNRRFGSDVLLAAATVNTSPRQQLARLWSPSMPASPRPPTLPEPGNPFVRESASGLVLGNDAFQISLTMTNGFAISGIGGPNGQPTRVFLSAESSLRCLVAGRALLGRDFQVLSKETGTHTVALQLAPKDQSVPIRLNLTFSVSAQQSGVGVTATVVNQGKKRLPVEVTLPDLRGIHFGDPTAAWLFFPQYRNVLTADRGSFAARNDCNFVVQFLCVFDPASTMAVSLLTENTDASAFDYLAAKSDTGCSLAVRHPDDFLVLQPGEARELTPFRLLVHSGGWKEAMRIYKAWADRTFAPQHAADREWFMSSWLIENIHLDPLYARQITGLPPLMRQDSSFRFQTAEFQSLTERYLGRRSDIIHLGAWFHDFSAAKVTPLWGDYTAASTFAQLGGIETFRQNIVEIREKHRSHSSIYTLPDRVHVKSKAAASYGNRFGVLDSKGNRVATSDLIKVSQDDPEYRQWQIGMLSDLQRQTAVDALYVDVFPFPNYKSYRREGQVLRRDNMNKASLEFARSLRAALPQTALWSEYPTPDYIGAYWDGAIVYHYLSLSEHFTGQDDRLEKPPLEMPLCLSVSRFTAPGVKNFVFPVGYDSNPTGQPSNLKQAFFMGDGFYSVGYLIFSERMRDFLKPALRVLSEYQDCFTSAHPELLLPALMAGVQSNAFPGNGRTAFTLLNTSYHTRRGPMLSVAHVAGSRYLNALTGEEISASIQNGRALLSATLAPQDVTCIIQIQPVKP